MNIKRKDRLNVEVTIPWDREKSSRKHVLEWLIETNGFQTMAEVGVRRGGTTFYLLDRFPNLKMYAIDTDISQFYNASVKEKYGERLIPMNMKSNDAANLIDDNSLDIVFIDADHSYEYVKNDIKKYTPKLKEGGILCGHDIDYPGVNRAVTELIELFDIAPNYVWIKRR